jgi:hypothetical protein
MPEGYCTLEDVRRALRSANLPGDINQDPQIAVDAVVSQTEPLEKRLKRHWFEPDSITEATEVDIPSGPKTRNDEHDLPRHAASVHGDSERDRRRHQPNSDALLEAGPRYERRRRDDEEMKREIRLAFGDIEREDRPAYTRTRFDRRDVTAVNTLMVVDEAGGFTDWTTEYPDGGVGNEYRGSEWWVRVNNGGWSELYLDVHAMPDDLASLSNAVYVDLDYGHEGIPRNVRRAVAFEAAADLVEEPAYSIPENARVRSVESKAEELREQADELLEVYE